jgi:hypothetical protein
VINNKVVDFAVLQNGFDLEKVFLQEAGLNGINQGNFFIHNKIGVVGNAIGQLHVVFKHVGATVVHADVKNVIGKVDLFHNR